MPDLSLWDHLLAALVGVVLPLGTLRSNRSTWPVQERWSTRDKVAFYWSNSAVLAILAGITLWVWHAGGRSFAQLGLTAAPTELGAGAGIAALFLVVYALDTRWHLSPARLSLTRRRSLRDTPFMPATRREIRHALVIVVSAAVCEEIVFRGFLVGYVVCFTGATAAGMSAAVLLPSVVFGVCHLYQGPRAAVKIVVLSAAFGALLVVTGSLWIPIALHVVVDLVGVLLGPRLMGESA